MSTPIPAEVEEYLRLIEGDSPRACKDQHALAAYVRGVFAREELTVDREQLDRYLSLTRYFDFPQLFPWEAFLLALWDCTYLGSPGTWCWWSTRKKQAFGTGPGTGRWYSRIVSG